MSNILTILTISEALLRIIAESHALLSKAQTEGRDVTDAELDSLQEKRQSAMEGLRAAVR